MNELIARKIKLLKEMAELSNIEKEKANKRKDKLSYMYWSGVYSAFLQSVEHLKDIQTEYEKTQQSLDEDLRFLRGE